MTKLFLTGYEKESLTDFLHKIEELHIKAVIDVRENPLSRKKGFSKNELIKALSLKGIKYYHFPQLGSPRKIRKKLYSTGDYLVFFKEYRKYIREKKSSVQELNEVILEEKRVTLLCFEKNNDLCHRTIITDEILKLNSQVMAIPI